MVLFEEALKIVLGQEFRTNSERIPFLESTGRILAEDVFSDIDMPPFDKSAVDGFACRMEDLPGKLRILETIPAGFVPSVKIGAGECSKIMTGAMLPDGADCVAMVEDSREEGNMTVAIDRAPSSKNICYCGEDVKKGGLVIGKGTIIKPAHIAIMASVGCTEPMVALLPKVAVISTGDELTEPHELPGKSKIRNSNAYQLLAQIGEVAAEGIYCGIASDTPESLREIMSVALGKADVVILTGGVSMGEFDYVPDVMKELGVEILFKSIAIQPGRPTVFGRTRDRFVFGLPGNPVSSFVLFEIMVKPFLRKMMGNTDAPVTFRLPLGVNYKRRSSARKSILPVVIRDGKIYPVEYHGSAHIHSYARTDGLVAIEIGQTEIREGELADVRPL